jgi:quercetin dioxygenase-like cupin family protein
MVIDEAAQHGRKYSKSKFDRIHHGQAPIDEIELEWLARNVYHIEPMLLSDFLFRTFRPSVAVRRPHDWVDVKPDLVGLYGVSYQVPCRRLADTDISITSLLLQPGASTPANRHPGHEVIVPLEGAVVVHIDRKDTPVRTGEHLAAHYFSRQIHAVENAGKEPARMLVLRFYE